jgi:hypothetical protein
VDGHELATTYTWQDAVAAGLTRADLRDDGVRVTRGAYVSRAVPLTILNACRAVHAVLPNGAVFSHLTAAALLGAPVPQGYPVHITVPPGVPRPQRRRIRVHVRGLLSDDVVLGLGLPVTSGVQTLLDLSATLPPDELVAIGDGSTGPATSTGSDSTPGSVERRAPGGSSAPDMSYRCSPRSRPPGPKASSGTG